MRETTRVNFDKIMITGDWTVPLELHESHVWTAHGTSKTKAV